MVELPIEARKTVVQFHSMAWAVSSNGRTLGLQPRGYEFDSHTVHGQVAPMVERSLSMREVIGSIPIRSTSCNLIDLFKSIEFYLKKNVYHTHIIK